MPGAALASGADADRARAGVYARVTRRNKVVAILRIALPGLGIVALALLGLRAIVGSTLPRFEFSNVSVDRDSLTVEAPIFSGVGADGSVYLVRAAMARTLFGNPNRLNLENPELSLTQLDGIIFSATSTHAVMDIADQVVTVEAGMAVQSTSGLSGTIWNSVMDVASERMVATGGADLNFGEDATIVAETMRYDGATRQWHFERSTVTLSELPGAEPSAERED